MIRQLAGVSIYVVIISHGNVPAGKIPSQYRTSTFQSDSRNRLCTIRRMVYIAQCPQGTKRRQPRTGASSCSIQGSMLITRSKGGCGRFLGLVYVVTPTTAPARTLCPLLKVAQNAPSSNCSSLSTRRGMRKRVPNLVAWTSPRQTRSPPEMLVGKPI